ncbi:hypothetical protein Pse7367_0755 [Thalassoporum mexicanum PCC 7367]|uniref:hypothetical protein n=1 Tax=Thalassoporum mexicanum TaxID=3457544 RepID=UPI00029FC214|nr:hypothetical protein [Pseudanabaena sp. PCC 7367]AFY69056.1 hypothetical protein Pse7367_0755 [Pseudanabaena sp. PCC 7367]
MEKLVFGLVGTIVLLVGSGLIYAAYRKMKVFMDCPPGKIYEATIGKNIALNGNISAESSLNSPFTQADCLFWLDSVVEVVRRGKSTKTIVLHNQFSEQPFMLSDGSGHIEVIPDNVQLKGKPHFQSRQGAFRGFKDERADRILADLDINPKMMMFRRAITVEERLLVPNQEIYVWGEVVNMPQLDDRHDRKLFRKLLPKLMSDRPKSAFYLEVAGFALLGLVFVLVGLGMLVNTFQM